jgi:hypothetical protein
MARRVELLKVADFTAGLNLTTDPFKIDKGESPELLNVDLDERGGVRQRRGTVQFGTGASVLLSDPTFITEHTSDFDGAKRILYPSGKQVYYTPTAAPAAFVAVPATSGSWTAGVPTITGPIRQASFEYQGVNWVFVERNAQAAAWGISSTTANIESKPMAAAGPSWQNSYTAGWSDHMPLSKTICAHQGFMWCANLTEWATPLPNRLRFSHPGVPASWRYSDYIDVPGLDGDEITALVSNGDHLLVFQRNATHAVYGYSPETFQFVTISTTVGAVSQEACVTTPNGCYAFDSDRGVYLHQGKREPEWQFSRLFPALRDHRIPQANLFARTRLGWISGRLWVTVPYQETTDDPVTATTFVLDPALSKDGTWTRYSYASTAYFADLVGNAYGSVLGSLRIQRLEQTTFTDSGADMASYYRTAWFDLGHPAIRKRWKRFEAVLGGGVEQQILVGVYRDYDTSAADRIVELDVEARDLDLVWDVGLWDTGAWRRTGAYDVIVKGGALGPARAVQLRFVGPSTPWSIDAFTLKYIQKRIR